ncbi:MAG: nucleoside-triphosphatase [Thermoanaerobaculia bacterium]|nr:nucleoside-triphosphatase [Thermoanaerobaculia bacterium]
MSAPPPLPEELVARWGSLPMGSLALLTGGRGAGKTRWCEALARAAREAKLAVRGVLSPPVLAGGEKRAIDLLDLATGSRRFLAERARPDLPGTEGLGWRFDPEALAAGNVALERVGACDLLLVDELGPLELGRGSGFTAAFGLLDARRHGLAIVVVRPSLVAAAGARWPGATRLWDLGGDR